MPIASHRHFHDCRCWPLRVREHLIRLRNHSKNTARCGERFVIRPRLSGLLRLLIERMKAFVLFMSSSNKRRHPGEIKPSTLLVRSSATCHIVLQVTSSEISHWSGWVVTCRWQPSPDAQIGWSASAPSILRWPVSSNKNLDEWKTSDGCLRDVCVRQQGQDCDHEAE